MRFKHLLYLQLLTCLIFGCAKYEFHKNARHYSRLIIRDDVEFRIYPQYTDINEITFGIYQYGIFLHINHNYYLYFEIYIPNKYNFLYYSRANPKYVHYFIRGGSMKKLILIFCALSLLVFACIFGRQFIFKEQIFLSEDTKTFIINKDFKSVKRYLLLNDITPRIAKYQGGEVISSKMSGLDVKTPLKDLKIQQNKDIIVKTKHGIFTLIQNIHVEANKIETLTILSEPDKLVQSYESKINLIESDKNRTKVIIEVKITIKENVPFKNHVQKQLDEAVKSNIDATEYIFTRIL